MYKKNELMKNLVGIRRALSEKDKGITLIALVITIIVLLILAAVTLNIILGENGIFNKARVSKAKFEYSSAKEIVELKLFEIKTDCIEKSQEYTLNLIADKLGMTEEETIEIIKYYEATASTELTIPESICVIVVIVKQYPEYKFLIGEEGTIEGITTGEVPNTYDATKFQSIEEFEQQYNFGAQTGTNQSSSPTITKYTVTFNTNGGSSVASQEVSAGGTATRPATDPTKDNHTFENWYSDSELTTEYNFASAVNGNITIYAKWRERQLIALIPNMTSKNTPSGVVSHYNGNDLSDEYDGITWSAYNAFDGDTSTFADTEDAWVNNLRRTGDYYQYMFDNEVTIAKIRTNGWSCEEGGGYTNIEFKRAIYVTTNGTSWTRIYVDDNYVSQNSSSVFEYNLTQPINIIGIKFVCEEDKTQTWGYRLHEAQCYGYE